MQRAAAWNIKGVGRQTRDVAEKAARRAGMSLGDWLDEVVAEQAAEQGVSPEDWSEDDRLDAIGDRLSRISDDGDDERVTPIRRRSREEARARRTARRPSRDESLRADELLDAAVERFEARAAKSEQRAAQAFESVATWLEDSENDRAAERATLRKVANKLDAIERRVTEPPAVDPVIAKFETLAARSEERAARAFESMAQLLQKSEAERDAERATLREVARKLERVERRETAVPARAPAPRASDEAGEFDAPPRRPTARPARERPALDVRESVAQIARRQSELDSRDSRTRASEPPRSRWRDFGVDRPRSDSRDPAPARSAGRAAEEDDRARYSTARTARRDVANAWTPADRGRPDTERPGRDSDLRAQVASMSRSVADLAPGEASAALDGAVGDLGDRLDAARRAGASDRLVAPVKTLIEEVRATLRDHDPRAATRGLEREIRALNDKVEALSRASVNPDVSERLRRQTEEVREQLADAAAHQAPFERLEQRIGELTERVERLATSSTPNADAASVIEMLTDARAEIERSIPASALASIERRLEQLAARMDDALRRSPAVDPRPLEDLARRIDGVRASVERQSDDHRPDAARVEAALREISAKLERPLASDSNWQALTDTIQDLAARVEEASRGSPAAGFDPRLFEDLARRIDGARAAAERQGDVRPHIAALASALDEIRAKLDRLPAAGEEARAVSGTLRELNARLDEMSRRPPPAAAFDPRPFEDLARRIDAARAAAERSADARPQVALMETALRDIHRKLDMLPNAGADARNAAATLRDMTERLEDALSRSAARSDFDPKPFEDLARQIEALRAAAERQGDLRPQVAKLESSLGGVHAKLDLLPALGPDAKALASTLQTLTARVDEALRRSATSANFDPRPFEDLAKRIEAVRLATEKQGDFGPRAAKLEAALKDIDAKLDRPPAGVDTRLLTSTLQDLTRRLEEAVSRPPARLDLKPIEDLARRIDGVRASVDRQGDFPSHAAKIEAALNEIQAKLERSQPAGTDPGPVTATLQGLTARLENALRLSAAQASFDPRPFEDLARRIEAVRAATERQGDFGPRAAKLEAALGDINAKLDRLPAAGIDTKALTSTLNDLTARLEDAFRRPAPAPVLDTRPIDDLARRIDGMRATLERQGDFKSHAAKVESALGEIHAKLERSPREGDAVAATLLSMTARLEDTLRRSASQANFDPRPFEDLAKRIEAVRLATERQGDFGPRAAKLEAALGDINAKLDRLPAAGIDTKALTSTLNDLTARLEEAFRRSIPAAQPDPRPIEDLARRIDGVRATVERQTDFGTHAAKLEAALSDIKSRLDRPPAPAPESGAMNSTLQDMRARLEEAFRRPALSAEFDPKSIEDLARRIEGVRGAIESRGDFGAGAPHLGLALGEISAKLDRQSVSPADLDALGEAMRGDLGELTGAMRELAERVDRDGVSGAGAAAIEDLVRELAHRPLEVDTRPIEAMLRDFGERFGSRAAPVAIDTSPIEHILSDMSARLEEVARPPLDPRPLEQAIRELHEKLDFRDSPRIDIGLVEQAADLLAQRLEARGGSAIDAEALVNQISEIHGRLDTLGSGPGSELGLERMVAELLDELEATREAVKAAQKASGPATGDIAELLTAQSHSDRRVQARLADVQDILEKVVDRLARIETEAARPEANAPLPASVSGARPPPRDSEGGLDAMDEAMRGIPDRAPRPPAKPEPRPALGVTGSLSGDDYLLEPGASAPAAAQDFDDDEDDDGGPAVPRNSGINAHIAAARRAAQAALMESATKSEAASAASRARGPDAAARTPSLKQAREFLATRRGPVLLGIAFLAVAATLAMVVFRGGHTAPMQKSELPAPAQSAAPIAAAAAGRAAGIDLAPVGALSAPRPAPSPALGGAPAPADLAAGLPATLPRALRDAATSGDAGAETEVAIRWLDGRMPSRDPKTAARWFEAAAAQALPVAQYRLAALYEKGIGVTRDIPLARSWYTKAANAGNARAMHNLAVLSAENGESGKPDYAEAAQWFRRAGELGIRDSQFNLGVLYGRGLGVPQDLAQSWVWFSLAARQGDADAGKKRDEVAAKMDAKAVAAAAQALADFKSKTPAPAANEAPAPAGGWDPPQASAPAVPAPAAAAAGRV